jgi:hypothetical protein
VISWLEIGGWKMKEFIINNWGDIASVFFIIASVWGIITRSTRQLHQDILEIKEENKRAHSRIDILHTNLNNLYTAMLSFLQKQGK